MPEPMTTEQLEFFSEQTRHAVHKAVTRYVRGAVVGFPILALGLIFALHTQAQDAEGGREAIVTSGRAVAVDSCNGRYQDREGLRNLLLSAEATIPAEVKRGNLTPDQAFRAHEFYNGQLAKLRLPDCRRAERVLTDDPEHTTSIPTPLYPPAQTLPGAAHDSILSG